MSIICKQCGFENPDGSTICEICAEPLNETVVEQVQEVEAAPSAVPSIEPAAVPSNTNVQATAQQVEANDGFEYSVTCPESNTKTILPNGNAKHFFCEGCKKEHEIDGFLWTIDRKEIEKENIDSVEATLQAGPTGDNLWLEEVNSHFRIEIDKVGGTLGRYGKYGADFFQSRGLLTVSGEHCVITNEFGNWVIRHVSKTNQTKYNNMILGTNEPNLLEDGKILTLANAVSFVVRIG